MILCKNCGALSKEDVRIYRDDLKKQNIKIVPVLPTCIRCGAQVQISHPCTSANIIVLNGTSGSGKTSVAEYLQNNGYLAMDGDCAIQSLRYKTGTKKYEWQALIEEIAIEIGLLMHFTKNIVLSHIVLPEDVEVYMQIFASYGLQYKFALLKPNYQTAVERCQTRTAHESVTPEVWIRHFYDLLVFDEHVVDIIDNTNQTIEETATQILNVPWRSPLRRRKVR